MRTPAKTLMGFISLNIQDQRGKAKQSVTWASVQLACRPATLRWHIHNTPIKCCWLRPRKSGGEILPLQPPQNGFCDINETHSLLSDKSTRQFKGDFHNKSSASSTGSTNGACVLNWRQLTILNSYSLSHSHVFQRSDGQWHATQHHML